MKLTNISIIILTLSVIAFAQQSGNQSDYEQAITLYRIGDYGTAAATLENVVKGDEKNRAAWLWLGMSYARLDKKKEAVTALIAGDKLPPASDIENPYDYQREKVVSTYSRDLMGTILMGTVKIAVEYGANGKIMMAVPIQKINSLANYIALHAVRRTKFKPLVKDGHPASTVGIVEYLFVIE